jgi:hypothetical protein
LRTTLSFEAWCVKSMPSLLPQPGGFDARFNGPSYGQPT